MTIKPEDVFDVVIVGSGGAGLTAALRAVSAGASVCVLERSETFGGTTAMSGGVAWIPGNNLMARIGETDTREKALAYLEALSLGKISPELIEIFVDTGPEVIDFIERETPLEMHALHFPDYHPEFDGSILGRSVMPDAFDAKSLGDMAPLLRRSPHFPIPLSLLDMQRSGGVMAMSMDEGGVLSSQLLLYRMQNDFVTSGTALVGGLMKAAIDRKVTLRSNARVRRLCVEDNSVTGVIVERAGGTSRISARRGVVLASGGFERNPQLTKDFLRGPLEACLGCPSNEGDGLLMAMEAGAALGNMGEAWWSQGMHIPGEEYEGQPFYRITTIERTMPGSIIVNSEGRRFVNEAHNYNDIGRAFHTFDPVKFSFTNLPAWMILHQGRLDRYAFLTRFPTDPIPSWLISAPTVRELAVKIGVRPDVLDDTVARFNAGAATGEDRDFGRGRSLYDHQHGDPRLDGAFRTLGALDQPPFYAIQIRSGTTGTKGGPRTNARAQVLNVHGRCIDGLYAAGNVMAGITGMAYPGAGGTIGPALVYGYIAGREAAGRHAQR
ncbi:FAD-dependent oxidoreductase [Sphingomonadaceae bacterium G21617-S1]|nr:FAD-dependent oxidoreductase [Sphingomonadaceae bacterium G21617-S1]